MEEYCRIYCIMYFNKFAISNNLNLDKFKSNPFTKGCPTLKDNQ